MCACVHHDAASIMVLVAVGGFQGSKVCDV